ncbi:MAG: hypothetical protein J6S97_03420 [Bacteroidales bacterium]|nr:hypothetical protein [Bacteroidales bacterium]
MKWLRNLLKGASLTGALFAFQACYGVRYSPFYETGEAPMAFTVVSHRSGEPLKDIAISCKPSYNDSYRLIGVTGPDGRCTVNIPYIKNEFGPYILLEDPEGIFSAKDTTLADLRERNIVVKMDNAR